MPMFSFSRLSSSVSLTLVACVMSCVSAGVHAADPVQGAATAPSAASTDTGKTYVVKPGDTLDKVVRNTMADSPLRADLLKDEIAKLNPQAFTKGGKNSLMAGVTLRLPRHEELLQKHLKPAVTGPANPTYEPSANERRQWVRYP